MAVFYYDKDDHPGGFIGHRAVTTLGDENSYKQRYFSDKYWGFTKGKLMAEALNARWGARAAEVRLSRRYDKITSPNRARLRIATNLTVGVYSRPNRINPRRLVWTVTINQASLGGHYTRMFGDDYDQTITGAITHYMSLVDVVEPDYIRILDNVPTYEELLDYLYKQATVSFNLTILERIKLLSELDKSFTK